ncbi:tetraacyldisaccharide 4'-kinase [Alteromonas oceanisediminis]|uniref:tetraacyldisaccharide 4'-kinase n=1 Tax=Alteromonas oceanisediminis TaxID=2836180 RepID=UPI001BDB2D86|nr:tetraacyldisaccharide 4'-kinase [Alteromonas oceanisediminis]MBT0586500.1 tetraacyldisaccharide 4'-kinase [Alteromonas oceanisediminis]
MALQQRLESAWQRAPTWLWLLAPFALLFAVMTAVRRALYRKGLCAVHHTSVPTIVVGNVSVGGNGKTPVVLALMEHFVARGLRVGVLSRGYGGTVAEFPYQVSANDCAERVGDEPWLIYSRRMATVVIDPNRPRGATLLCALHCDVIICDDGLQHYALGRDIEIVVMDKRQLGNGYLLPMGPLRESRRRLARIDCLVRNGQFPLTSSVQCSLNGSHAGANTCMILQPVCFINVADSSKKMTPAAFAQKYPAVIAACAIGNPNRFLETLHSLNIKPSRALCFNDHHQFASNELPRDALVITEKDAGKVTEFAHPDWWYLRVDAVLDNAFYQHVDSLLAAHKPINQ